MPKYIAMAHGRIIGVYNSFAEALRTLVEVGEGEIYRGELILRLGPEEAEDLKGYLPGVPLEPVEVPETPSPRKGVAVVLDQMFKGFFTEVLSGEFRDIEIHEIVGKGLEKTIRVGNIFRHPAANDYDVARLVEILVEKGKKVIFFTGDKKLYNHIIGYEDVVAYYAPPNEFPGKEALAKFMVEKIKENLG